MSGTQRRDGAEVDSGSEFRGDARWVLRAGSMRTDQRTPVNNAPAFADKATVDYFDSHQHHYSAQRIEGVANLLREHVAPGAKLCDVSSGGGEILDRLAAQLGIEDLTAIDASHRAIERVQERLPTATTIRTSICDEHAMSPWHGQFDVVLVSAVLHHLVTGTRRGSSRSAWQGLRNASRLVKPGGVLVVLEPVFSPRPVTWLVFWIKRLVTQLTTGRVPILGYWNNIGAPVVSFYSAPQVRNMVTGAGAQIVREGNITKRLGYADLVLNKTNLSLVARIPSADSH